MLVSHPPGCLGLMVSVDTVDSRCVGREVVSGVFAFSADLQWHQLVMFGMDTPEARASETPALRKLWLVILNCESLMSPP